MATRPQKTYVSTVTSGLVIQVEHNLEGTPDIFLTEIDGGGEKYVSLFDARIAEIKTLDPNTLQLTFSSAFAGFVGMHVIEADRPSVNDRMLNLEEKYIDLLGLIEDKVSLNSFSQMNTLVQSQIKSLQTQIDNLSSELALLKTDVAAL